MGKHCCFRTLGLVVIGAMILCVSSVQADTTIDTFEDDVPATWPVIANSGTPFVATSEPGLAGVVGGVRDGTVSHTSGPLNVTGAVLIGPGIYSLSLDALTDGLSTLSYDAGGAGLNLDLLDPHGTGATQVDGFVVIDVLTADLGGVPIDVTLTDGGGGSDTQGGIAAGGGMVSIPLASYVGVDFSDIDSVEFQFDPAAEFDLTIDFLGFDWVNGHAPEPSSAVLGLLGLSAMFFYRRRRVR